MAEKMCFHPLIRDKNLFFYLMLLSRRGPENPSTPNFGNVNLTETMTNLIVAWKIQSNFF